MGAFPERGAGLNILIRSDEDASYLDVMAGAGDRGCRKLGARLARRTRREVGGCARGSAPMITLSAWRMTTLRRGKPFR